MGFLGTIAWWDGDTCGFSEVGRCADREVRDIGRQVLLAISDTWFENWNVTLGLGVVHLVILRFGYRTCSNL